MFGFVVDVRRPAGCPFSKDSLPGRWFELANLGAIVFADLRV